MNNIEYYLPEISEICLNNSHFRVFIYFKYIDKRIDDIIQYFTTIKDRVSILKHSNAIQINFYNGSYIMIRNPNESCRGYKSNILIIEQNINKDIIDILLMPTLIDYRFYSQIGRIESKFYIFK